jgi:sulfite exporter TauE/SafE
MDLYTVYLLIGGFLSAVSITLAAVLSDKAWKRTSEGVHATAAVCLVVVAVYISQIAGDGLQSIVTSANETGAVVRSTMDQLSLTVDKLTNAGTAVREGVLPGVLGAIKDAAGLFAEHATGKSSA